MNIAANFSKETLTFPGVYQIKNIIDCKKYVGSSVNIWQRWGKHLSTLRKNKHSNPYLQNAFNLYGENNFEFSVLIFCDRENTLLYEQACLDGLKPEYNLAVNALSPFAGLSQSDEAKVKISAAKTGENHPLYGKHHTEETRRKISEANTGKHHTEETKRKLSEANTGKHLSEEHKQKISEAKSGKKHKKKAES